MIVCAEREEGRLEPRLESVQLTGNTTALNGSASYSKRDGTICVAQDLFPGDNSVLISHPQSTERVREREAERESACEGCAFLSNLCLHAPPSRHFLRCPGRSASEQRS